MGTNRRLNWADAMHSFILSKVDKAPGYEKFDENWLAILDSWVVPALDRSLAAEKLIALLRAENVSMPFGRVYILSHPEVLRLTKEVIEDRA